MPEELRAAVARFLKQCRRPALLEPGEEILPLSPDNYALEIRGSRLVLQAWSDTRNLARRLTAQRAESPGRMELLVERFARREGHLFLVDLDRPAGQAARRRGTRLVFRELFREMLSRQYPGWTIVELSAEPNLQHSLSPAYPRAFLRRGQSGWAAIVAPPETDAAAVLTFGLIWLDYLRRREHRAVVEGLAVFVPAGKERTTCLRLRWLHSAAARFEVLVYSPEGFASPVDAADIGNLDTRLEACRVPTAIPPPLAERLSAVPGYESVALHDGSVALRVHGLEFARAGAAGIRFGLSERVPALDFHYPEIERLARSISEARSHHAARRHPLYRHGPEAWLESQVRANLPLLDATLLPQPLYGQVPAFAGGERGVLDLLAAAHTGRLAVLELKASQDPQLPLQALDYWMRVRWHLELGEFTGRGYFPGLALHPEPPRLLLVSPALDFHPTTETVLSYFAPCIPVERIGVGVEWRKGIRVMFRLYGAERPGLGR